MSHCKNKPCIGEVSYRRSLVFVKSRIGEASYRRILASPNPCLSEASCLRSLVSINAFMKQRQRIKEKQKHLPGSNCASLTIANCYWQDPAACISDGQRNSWVEQPSGFAVGVLHSCPVVRGFSLNLKIRRRGR